MPTTLRKLLDIRDLLRTGTAPTSWGMTEDEWMQHKINRAAGHLTEIIEDLQAKEARRKLSSEEKLKLRIAEKKLRLRNQHRGSTCLGCHYNRYNFESSGDAQNAPTTGEGCYFLTAIRRGKCSQKPYRMY